MKLFCKLKNKIMSQIETRQNIVSIDSISEIYYNAVSISESILEIFENVKKEVNSSITVNNIVTKYSAVENIKHNSIDSPEAISKKFQKLYTKNMSKSANIEIQTQKHTLIQSIVELPFQITEPDKIKDKIIQLHRSDVSNVKTASNNLIKEVEKQHCSVFKKELSRIVSLASQEAGFKTINIRTNDLNPVVVAINNEGKGIISEVKINDKSKQIDIISETVGITDGSCHDIMNKYSNSLKKYGVKFSTAERKITGGKCQNPLSIKVETNIKLTKEREILLNRLRKTGSNLKSKN